MELTLSLVRTCGASRGDPIIKMVANEVRRPGRLLHLRFHGKCMKTISDFLKSRLIVCVRLSVLHAAALTDSMVFGRSRDSWANALPSTYPPSTY